MKKHNGMRSQDIVILLGIIALDNDAWRNLDLATMLRISPSEVSEGLNRCAIARLIDQTKRHVHTSALREFLVHGLKYVFPAQPGAVVRGVFTGHSGPPINRGVARGEENYVWPYEHGTVRGQSIQPLYKTVPDAATQNQAFYELLVITDTLRIGRAREVGMATRELERRLGEYAGG